MRLAKTLLYLAAIVGLLVVFDVCRRQLKAQEIEMGQGVICDTVPQMQRFVQLARDDPQLTADEVNKEFNSPTGCMLGMFAFVRGEKVAKEGAWDITEVLVLGIYLPHGWQRTQPFPCFTAFPNGERGA